VGLKSEDNKRAAYHDNFYPLRTKEHNVPSREVYLEKYHEKMQHIRAEHHRQYLINYMVWFLIPFCAALLLIWYFGLIKL
jgi:hypothetical protein